MILRLHFLRDCVFVDRISARPICAAQRFSAAVLGRFINWL